METRQLLVILFAVIFINCTFGQDTTQCKTENITSYKWGAGLGAGFTSGFGVSFKFRPSKFGIQLNLFPYLDDYGKRNFICIGLTLTQELWHNNINAFFLYLANSYTSDTRKPYYNNSNEYVTSSTDNTGIGVGFEQLSKNKRFAIDIMAGYAQYDSFKQMFLTGEIAFHYLFARKN